MQSRLPAEDSARSSAGRFADYTPLVKQIASSPTVGTRTVAAMSSITTRWSVRQEHRVTPDDLDAEGLITDEAVARWVALARSAYLEQCPVLEDTRTRFGLDVRDHVGPHPGGARLGLSPTVIVSATATEVRPTSFVISVRLRPVGGDREDPLNVTCVIRLQDPATGEARDIGDEIRDELIAHEHAARHFN